MPRNEVATAVLADPAGRLLLVRRAGDGLLGGLWEFPGAEVRAGEAPERAAAGAAASALGRSVGATEGRPLDVVVHVFSHLKTTYRPYVFRLSAAGRLRERPVGYAAEAAWLSAEEVEARALPVAQRKIAARAREVG